MNNINDDFLKYIIARLINNAIEAKEDSDSDKKDDFKAGRRLAYYEMLDILKSELYVRDIDLKEFGIGLDVD